MAVIRLRAATPADLPILLAWDEQPHVIDSGGDDDVFDWAAELPRAVDWREMLMAEVNGRTIGVIQIIDPAREETHYWGDAPPNLRAIDIWIGDAADLGKGYGTEMMRLALARCFAPPEVEAVLIDPLVANTRAIAFYRRLGFQPVGERRFGDDDCLVMRLDRAGWVSERLGEGLWTP
jgi:aminoglycoside 6'-N-acetyltransferase